MRPFSMPGESSVKQISLEEKQTLRRKLRDLLNQLETSNGADAVLIYFKRAPDGINLGIIQVGDPPTVTETIAYLVQYIATTAYEIGMEEGLGKCDPNHGEDPKSH